MMPDRQPILMPSIEELHNMSTLIENILNKDYNEADSILEEKFIEIMENKLHEMKKSCASKMSEQMMTRAKKLRMDVLEEDDIEEAIDPTEIYNGPAPTGQRVNQADKGDKETNTTVVPKNNLKEEEDEQLDEARIAIVKARIRGGKIQRRKKVSNVSGYKLQGGQLTRMSAAERRKRKLGAKRAKIKRKSKMSRTLQKRRRSLMKRKALGL